MKPPPASRSAFAIGLPARADDPVHMSVGSSIRLSVGFRGADTEVDYEALPRLTQSLVAAPVSPNDITVGPTVRIATSIEKTISGGPINHKAFFVFVGIIIRAAASQLDTLKRNMPVLL
jgi:hypothetical protein